MDGRTHQSSDIESRAIQSRKNTGNLILAWVQIIHNFYNMKHMGNTSNSWDVQVRPDL